MSPWPVFVGWNARGKPGLTQLHRRLVDVVRCITLPRVRDADWTHRGEYIVKRGLPPAHAEEVLGDPNRIVINPDPASMSGRGVRIIGYSTLADAILVVIVTEEDGVVWGLNAWEANARDLRAYQEQD